jgi:pimeloyl-ACP methyl ester carboxylesterase
MSAFHLRYRFGAASDALRLAYLRVALVAFLVVLASLVTSNTRAASSPSRPTVVLVHGAFADASSWNGVIALLLADGYPVIAVANPLRGVRSDAQVVAEVIDSVPGKVVLVGHSYGGNVITNAATGKANVKALVYVGAFAPDAGESVSGLAGKLPGSTLGPALATPIPLADGNKDLYIVQARFHAQFAADLPVAVSDLMGAGQRPITEAALNEPSGQPAWRDIPSWFIYGSFDKNIPPALQPFMARRANAKDIVQVLGGSHVVMTSHPKAVTKVIEQAAAATCD